MATMSSQSFRRYILTASVAAITATGTWYGAGLKARQELKQERTAATQTSPAEKIDQLEMMKSRLLQQRAELQSKIDRFTAKASANASDLENQTG